MKRIVVVGIVLISLCVLVCGIVILQQHLPGPGSPQLPENIPGLPSTPEIPENVTETPENIDNHTLIFLGYQIPENLSLDITHEISEREGKVVITVTVRNLGPDITDPDLGVNLYFFDENRKWTGGTGTTLTDYTQEGVKPLKTNEAVQRDFRFEPGEIIPYYLIKIEKVQGR